MKTDEEKLRHLRKMVDEGTPCFDKAILKDRGWTPAMIRDLLADIEIKFSATCGMVTFKYYYEKSKVEAVEQTQEFIDRKRKNEERQRSQKARS